MTRADKAVVLLLCTLGVGGLFALVPVFMPFAWMPGTHRWLGLCEMPTGPVVENLARSLSALMQHGIAYLERVRNDLRRWLGDNGWNSALQIQGQLSRRAVADPAVYERVNYMQVVTSYKPDLPGTHWAR
jgi:hypothetical protein